MPRTMTRDHPRMGREKTMYFEDKYFCRGSPPRRRGKVVLTEHHHAAKRITPAWAGKSPWTECAASAATDHPRVGGEKYLAPFLPGVQMGSPPHGRGKGRHVCGIEVVAGITPAWSGKSSGTERFPPQSEDHPRVGGEKPAQQGVEPPCMGSPPRGRGKARHLSHGLLPCG